MNCKRRSRFPRNDTMCKDKWNTLNSNCTKIAYYHKGTGMHTCFWDLMFKEKERFHLLCVFNREYYESIDVFQGEKVINVPIHVKDVNAKGDVVYKPFAQETQDENEDFNSHENVQEAPNPIPDS